MAQWIWTQRCGVTGETVEVNLTEADKLEIESRPTFTGWTDGELREVGLVKSHGHIAFCPSPDYPSGIEYFDVNGEVYRAPASAPLADITSGPTPCRHGRWVSSRAHFERFRALYLVSEKST